jgi:hypothetical protein
VVPPAVGGDGVGEWAAVETEIKGAAMVLGIKGAPVETGIQRATVET